MLSGKEKRSISIPSFFPSELKQVTEFKYLGTTFKENRRMDREIRLRVIQPPSYRTTVGKSCTMRRP
jgi:hypothetical protein